MVSKWLFMWIFHRQSHILMACPIKVQQWLVDLSLINPNPCSVYRGWISRSWQISEKKRQAFVGCTDTSYRERFYPLCIVYIHQTDCYVYLEVNSNSMAKVWTCHKSWPIVGGKSKCGCLQAWNKAETTPDLLGGQNALKSCERVLVLR